MNCLICEKNNLNFFDDYRYNIKTDKEYFNNPEIFRCPNCDLSFCNPMPSVANLNTFYSNIYRAHGRPHEFDIIDIRNNNNNNNNISYLEYLEKFIDLERVYQLFDFGSGTGCLGHFIKKKYQKIENNCAEKDRYCKKILEERGYKNYENIDKVNNKFDLIISLHSLEHLTDLKIFEKFKKLSKVNTYIFIEVPNCEINEFYKDRPYDSPHLIFFTKKSFEKIAQKYSLEIIDISYASITLKRNFELMKVSKKKYENWQRGRYIDKAKSYLRKALKYLRIIKNSKNTEKIIFKEDDKYLSNIRVIFKVI
ncbi:methyltransferase domain-containing protein [Candidatus Pelagibacter sp. HIMB1321]|uniref:methyltransferase domain-containing protein n=1 Tax=Candidatus Pelagibacter sp. HIMB1321 TaxID=1388755 RepID=UPI000A07E42F|nr:methyltransferase domain-containing protein [Candidatus Pelagibacter sp. HIMB1321]SMF79462.1 Methyltransferase domain-containing protein [Candidatus Pelagibacter sp. HIMB1321]